MTNEPRALRVGVSGCGGITSWALERLAMRDDCAPIALQDPDDGAREALGSRFDIATRVASYDELLAVDGLDFVLLNGPNDVHREQAEAAFARGLPALIQKPLARTAAEGRAIVAAARAAGVRVGVVLMELGDPLWHQVRTMLRDGCFGDVVLVQSLFAHDLWLQEPPRADDWRLDERRVGGGAFLQLAVHQTALARWLLDRDVAEVVGAARVAREHTAFADETTVALVRFAGEGAPIAQFGASWATNGGMTFGLFGTAGRVVVDVAGTLHVTSTRDAAGPVFTATAGEPLIVPAAELERARAAALPATEIHSAFARWLRDDEPFAATGDFAVADLELHDRIRTFLDGNSRSAVNRRGL